MVRSRQPRLCMSKIPPAHLAFLGFLLTLVMAQPVPAQTFQVIHTFQGPEGLAPYAGVTLDRGGNLYGTARDGGSFNNGYFCELYEENGCGAVFKLTKRVGSGWLTAPLFKFNSTDGAYPRTPVTIGPGGSIYGSTDLGGYCSSSGFGCGTIFSLMPGATAPPAIIAPWMEHVLYAFTGNDDGGPGPSALIFDSAGNMFGSSVGGKYGAGNVFEFTPSGQGWTETVLYSFYGAPSDGQYPQGIVADAGFNHLFGVTFKGGNNDCDDAGCGTVFELTRSGSNWTETILHTFTDGADGAWPLGPPIMDSAGNLYGTSSGAFVSPGTVWELSPTENGWVFTVLYTFSGGSNRGPYGGIAMDTAGNLYGTTNAEGAYDEGNIFKLGQSHGVWTYTDLHDFTGGNDGAAPEGAPTVDTNGNVFGTASGGGLYGIGGVVWEITAQ